VTGAIGAKRRQHSDRVDPTFRIRSTVSELRDNLRGAVRSRRDHPNSVIVARFRISAPVGMSSSSAAHTSGE